MLMNILFFLMAGATLSLLLWSGMEIFRTQEDPLGERLEELQSQALVVAQRTARRKIGGTGLDRILSVVGMFPGGEDWMRGSDRLLRRAGVRNKYALAVYTLGTILWTLLLLAGLIWVKRDELDSSLLGGVV